MARQRQFTPLQLEALKGFVRDGDQYASQLWRNVANATNEEVNLKPGTLTPMLKNFQQKGLIEDLGAFDDTSSVGSVFGITPEGLEALKTEMDIYDEITSEARSLLQAHPFRRKES